MYSESAWATSSRRFASILTVLLLSACAGESLREPLDTDTAAPDVVLPAPVQPPADPVPEPAPPPVRFSVAAVGDMMLGTDYPENHLPDDDGVSFLADVAPLLRDADITFGNLEGVLIDGGTPRKECKNPQACYLFRTPSRYARYFLESGFDVLSLANNHARDFGEVGRTETMRNLDAAGIRHSGREGDFARLTVKGLDVVLIAFAVTLNSNLVLDYDIAEDLVRGFAETHDIVLISFHAGAEGENMTRLPFAEEEYFGEMRGDVVRFSRAMVDAGADLVLGHGPHVVRAMELYKERLIAYSLGNFATYYGISVEGIKGVAPILVTTLDESGRFVKARIHSTVQLRPAGPSIDPEQKALKLIKSFSIQDFNTPGLRFLDDGGIMPAPRIVKPHVVDAPTEKSVLGGGD